MCQVSGPYASYQVQALHAMHGQTRGIHKLISFRLLAIALLHEVPKSAGTICLLQAQAVQLAQVCLAVVRGQQQRAAQAVLVLLPRAQQRGQLALDTLRFLLS